MSGNIKVERPKVEGLLDPPHFENAVTTEGGKLIHLSDQLVTEGDLAEQFDAVFEKLKLALETCGATANRLSASATLSSAYSSTTGTWPSPPC